MNTALYPRNDSTLRFESQKDRLGSYYCFPNYFDYKLRRTGCHVAEYLVKVTRKCRQMMVTTAKFRVNQDLIRIRIQTKICKTKKRCFTHSVPTRKGKEMCPERPAIHKMKFLNFLFFGFSKHETSFFLIIYAFAKTLKTRIRNT
jgi:hypothetical protein